jgi:predicted HD superfamily hydrolase involved in NAD metabolism
LQKPSRQAHTLRVAMLAAERAAGLPIAEGKAVQACLLHDCAKNLRLDDPLLKGFIPPKDCPPAVVHQYAGEFVARTALGVDDEEVLSAVACHTSGKENMSLLDKLVFLADLVEEERSYPGVENLRQLFWEDIDECLLQALEDTVEYLERSGQPVYEKTIAALRYHRIQCNKEK